MFLQLSLVLGGLVFGICLGVFAASFFWRTKMQAAQQIQDSRLKDLQTQEEIWKARFRELAAEVLESSAKIQAQTIQKENQHELDKKKQTFDQSFDEIRKNLKSATDQIQTFEKERVDQYAKLERSLQTMMEQERKLATETERLKTALTTSQSVRGRWGELVLRNILLQSDLLPGVDFEEQSTTENNEGDRLKPDVIVKLPQSGQRLVIDAKTSLYESYIKSETPVDETDRKRMHADFATRMWERVMDLSSKEYQKHVTDSVPYVILFIPSEAAIRAAFDTNPDLFQKAMDRKVFIASPATIIPLILLIAHGWRQYKMSKQAQELAKVVEQLGDRMVNFVDRLGKVQKGIDAASKAWNEAIDKSWNGNQSVQKSIERARELGAHIGSVSELPPIETSTRALETDV